MQSIQALKNQNKRSKPSYKILQQILENETCDHSKGDTSCFHLSEHQTPRIPYKREISPSNLTHPRTAITAMGRQ